MARIRSNAGSLPIELEVYDSGGDGRPVVLVHGWPLSAHSWKPQQTMLESAGFRVVAYDRRGFGVSDHPDGGYDYDTMAGDLRAIVEHLHLRGMALVGFSMGGGELARYVGRHGTDDVAAMVFASAVPPYLRKTDDNPEGRLDDDTVREMKNGLSADRDGFFADFAEKFYTASGELRVDRDVVENWRALAAPASTRAALDCIDAFSRTDFRDDLHKIDVPTLVIHGDGDEIVPIDVSGRRTAEMVGDAKLHIIHGGPHGILDSHTEEFNEALLDFLLELR